MASASSVAATGSGTKRLDRLAAADAVARFAHDHAIHRDRAFADQGLEAGAADRGEMLGEHPVETLSSHCRCNQAQRSAIGIEHAGPLKPQASPPPRHCARRPVLSSSACSCRNHWI